MHLDLLEHPPVRGKNVRDHRLQKNTKPFMAFNGFPEGSNIGSQQYNTREKPIVVLYT